MVLVLLWCNPVIASCGDDIEFVWKYVGKDRVTHVKKNYAHYAKFSFKSTSDKTIRITRISLLTADGNIVKRDKYNEFYIKPYGKDSDLMYGMSDLNLDVVTSGSYGCTFENPPAASKTRTKKSKSSIGAWIKWIAIVVVGGAAFLMLIGYLDEKKESKTKNKNVSKTSKDPPTISEAALFNLIKKIWEGDEDLVKAFWIYFIVISNIVWFIGGFLYGALNALWILIFPLAVMIITAGGAWNSSTKYKNQKLKEKKGYGWAIAAKVVIVLGFLSLAGNFADLLK